MGKRACLVVAVSMLVACGGGFSEQQIFTPSPAASGEPKVEFGSPRQEPPLFQVKYEKANGHLGLPWPEELAQIKSKGTELGASVVVLDCPRPGSIGYGVCIVYGYK